MGSILVGVFAVASVNKVSGLIEGNLHQLAVQCLAVVICVAYTFGVTWLILKVLNVFEPVRVADEVELSGLDAAIHGESAYDFSN